MVVERRDSSLYMGKLPKAKFKWRVRPICYAYINLPLGSAFEYHLPFAVFNQNATDFSAFSSASFFDLPYTLTTLARQQHKHCLFIPINNHFVCKAHLLTDRWRSSFSVHA